MNEAVIEELKEKIGKHLNLKLDLVINENRSTMLSVLEKTRRKARLSIHKMFLEAPEPVITAVASYVRGNLRSSASHENILRGYIQTHLSQMDYSDRVKRHKLISKGHYYDLKALYNELNAYYFDNRLKLEITWFGRITKRSCNRVIFGQYFDHLKLIKIHSMMDHLFFPLFFVRFVIYHEMLHDVVPGHIDGNGIYRSHGAVFKKREKEFEEYEQAIEWEKKNKKLVFSRQFLNA